MSLPPLPVLSLVPRHLCAGVLPGPRLTCPTQASSHISSHLGSALRRLECPGAAPRFPSSWSPSQGVGCVGLNLQTLFGVALGALGLGTIAGKVRGRPVWGKTLQEPTSLSLGRTDSGGNTLGALIRQEEAGSPPEILSLPGLFRYLVPSVTSLSRGHFHLFSMIFSMFNCHC